MIGKIVGAVVGAQAAKHSRSVGGTGGALLGALAVPVLRRLSLPALIVLGAGGYAAKKLADKSQNSKPRSPATA